jgi:protein-arginine kinase
MEPVGPITSLKQIDTETREGRLLLAAVAILKNRCFQGKTEAEIILDLNTKAKHIFENDK